MDIVNQAFQDAIRGLLDQNDKLKKEVIDWKNQQKNNRHVQEKLELDRMNFTRDVGRLKQELVRANGDTAAQAQHGLTDENQRNPNAFEEMGRRYLQKKEIEKIQQEKEEVKRKCEAANKLLTNLVKKGVDERALLESENVELIAEIKSLEAQVQSSTEREKSLEKKLRELPGFLRDHAGQTPTTSSPQNEQAQLKKMTKERDVILAEKNVLMGRVTDSESNIQGLQNWEEGEVTKTKAYFRWKNYAVSLHVKLKSMETIRKAKESSDPSARANAILEAENKALASENMFYQEENRALIKGITDIEYKLMTLEGLNDHTDYQRSDAQVHVQEILDLKEKLDLQAPLIQVAVSIRRRFIQHARFANSLGRPDQVVVQMGNQSVHDGDILADSAMITLGLLSDIEMQVVDNIVGAGGFA